MKHVQRFELFVNENMIVDKADKANGPAKGKYGYIQKGNRYHWKIEGEIFNQEGFKSKKEADVWIEDKGFEWRAGYAVHFYGERQMWILVDKKGNEVKT